MSFIEILLIGIGLSMDAFAVALCKGLSMKKIDVKASVIIAIFFGAFQAVMPLIGYFVCINFEKFISSFDHWIAFGLLEFIGIKMIIDAVKERKKNEEESEFHLKIGELFILAIATSIDALAVGVSFACVDDVNIFTSVLIIGVTTFILSFIGVFIGNKFGAKFKTTAAIIGGIILILIGVKIIIEHILI